MKREFSIEDLKKPVTSKIMEMKTVVTKNPKAVGTGKEISRTYVPLDEDVMRVAKLKPGDRPECRVMDKETLLIIKRKK